MQWRGFCEIGSMSSPVEQNSSTALNYCGRITRALLRNTNNNDNYDWNNNNNNND